MQNQEPTDHPEPSPQRCLIHLVAGNRWGGSRQYALDICSHFKEKGWRVCAVTRDAKAIDDRFRKAGIELHHAPLRGLIDPSTAFSIAKILKEVPPGAGVIHAHRYRDVFSALVAKRLAGRMDIPVIVTRHTVTPARETYLLRRVYAKTDAHIFVSDTARERFLHPWRSRKCPIPPERIHVIHNSIPVSYPAPVPLPERGPKIALCAGAVTPGRGLENAIDALVSLRDLKLRLRIVGNGLPDYLDSLRRRAMTRGVMEMIDWRIGPEPAPALFEDCHFGVQPSMEREAFGLDNLRLMAMGRAQVCSPNGAQNEYLRDGETALFVPPADSHALAAAIRRLATDTELRDSIADAAFKKFNSDLSWTNFISQIEDIYG